ncbi:MAG: hypothetical protein ACKVWV_01090 [Planctomycetota bacterium]
MSELRPYLAPAGVKVAALVALAAAALAPRALEAFAFRAEPGQRIKRHHRTETTGTLERVEVEFGAESRTENDPGVTFETTTTIDVTDAIAAVTDGRPTRFVRTFDALDRRAVQSVREANETKREEHVERCAVAQRAVAFEWNASANEFAKRFEDGEQDADALEPLVEDMDLREFLPSAASAGRIEGDVELGLGWTVPFSALKLGVLRPAGRLVFEGESVKRSAVETRLLEAVWDALDGSCRATLRAVRVEAGAHLGVIAIEADMTSHATAAPEAGASVDPARFDVVYRGRLEGEITWDLSAGRARSLRAEWRTERTLTEIRPAKTKDGASVELRRKLVFRDTSRCRYDIDAS